MPVPNEVNSMSGELDRAIFEQYKRITVGVRTSNVEAVVSADEELVHLRQERKILLSGLQKVPTETTWRKGSFQD